MKNFEHKKLAIRSAFRNEQKWTQLPFLEKPERYERHKGAAKRTFEEL